MIRKWYVNNALMLIYNEVSYPLRNLLWSDLYPVVTIRHLCG